jgi:hypothetical protein
MTCEKRRIVTAAKRVATAPNIFGFEESDGN